MSPLSRGTLIALVFALVVGAAVLYVHSSRKPNVPSPEPEPISRGERLRQRMQQLQGARRAAPAAEARDPIAGRGTLHATPQRTPATRMAGGSVPAAPQTGPAVASEDDTSTPDPDDIPALKRIALENPDPEERLAAVVMLGASEDPQAAAVLAKALSDEDEEVRMAALESLSEFTDEPPIEAIESALNDPSAEIRFEALTVLADVGGEQARRAIERALHDPDEDVRALAESLASEQAPEVETPQPNH
jgi:hypothetical protein